MKDPVRFDGIEESATVRVADKANELRASGVDVISFSLGEPDFPTPKHICDAAAKAMNDGKTHYTSSAGIPELREAIAEKLRTENRLDVKAKQVLVTPGAKHAIYEVCMSILDEGDEAILFDPAWVTLDACIKVSGAKTKWVSEVEDLHKAITKKTKLIIVNSPNNPAGYVFSKEELKTVADLAIDRDLFVLSDEVYEKIVYDVEQFSIGSMDGMPERTITINAFSKSYAMTGWRLGYAVAPPQVFRNMLKLQQHTATCATSFVQYGGLAALKGDQKCVAEMVKEFHARRDLIISGLNSIGLRCEKPDGAFYVFLDVSKYGDGLKVSELLLNKGHVAVTPGGDFGPSGKNRIRFSYATSRENISEGVRRIGEALETV